MTINALQLGDILRSQCGKYGQPPKWAREHGVPAFDVYAVLDFRRKPSIGIANALGYKRTALNEYKKRTTE